MKTGNALERGKHDFAYDTINQILLCRLQDNKEVTKLQLVCRYRANL